MERVKGVCAHQGDLLALIFDGTDRPGPATPAGNEKRIQSKRGGDERERKHKKDMEC